MPKSAARISLEELSEYESVKLFVERARAVKPNFALREENAPSVAEICLRLDGLPLAIELAAERVRIIAPASILEKLENREITPQKFFDIKSLKWLPDGDHLLLTAMDGLDGKSKIWQVSTATGEAQQLTKDAANLVGIS